MRQTDDQPITTRAARERLPPKHEPYWRRVDTATAVGYRRTDRGGFWTARVMIDGRYRKGALGRADDATKADGVNVLDFRQAETKAREWAARENRKAVGLETEHSGRPYTVADAVRDYVAAYKLRGGKGGGRMQDAINAHILPALGSVRLDRLTRNRVEKWRDATASAPPRLRTSRKSGAAQRTRPVDLDNQDVMRARRASANRVLTVLKAALNHAHQAGRVSHDDGWKLAKPFRKVDAPRIRYLGDTEATRLLNACGGEFRQLVVAALLTGMRYGELAGMDVADFHPEPATISLSPGKTKGGKARLIYLTDEGRDFFTASTAGKERSVLVFRRADGEPWGRSHQFRPLREACKAAKITPAIGFHILRHTYASRLVMSGVPMSVVAQQIGDSEAITAKHYAHLAPSYVGDMVRQALNPLGVKFGTNVAPFRPLGNIASREHPHCPRPGAEPDLQAGQADPT